MDPAAPVPNPPSYSESSSDDQATQPAAEPTRVEEKKKKTAFDMLYPEQPNEDVPKCVIC